MKEMYADLIAAAKEAYKNSWIRETISNENSNVDLYENSYGNPN